MAKRKEVTMTAQQRLDAILVERGLAGDLKEARSLIMAGKVIVNDQRVDKPGTSFRQSVHVRVKEGGRFVSRGGDKLQGALVDLGMLEWVAGRSILDIGSSTGGFTDCLLQAGARRVVAVDVGTNQLAYELRTDPRVTVFEKQDVRTLNLESMPIMDLVVADVSFNSLSRLAEAFWKIQAASPLTYLLLVKPQFELDVELVDHGGVVPSVELQMQAVKQVQDAFADLGGSDFESCPSKVAGRTGNQEHFLKFYRK